MTVQRNVGIDATQGDVVVFVDDDRTFEPGLFVALLNAYSDPTGVGVTGRIDGLLHSRVGGDRIYLFGNNFPQTLRARAAFAALLALLCAHRLVNREWSGLLSLLEGMRQAHGSGRRSTPHRHWPTVTAPVNRAAPGQPIGDRSGKTIERPATAAGGRARSPYRRANPATYGARR